MTTLPGYRSPPAYPGNGFASNVLLSNGLTHANTLTKSNMPSNGMIVGMRSNGMITGVPSNGLLTDAVAINSENTTGIVHTDETRMYQQQGMSYPSQGTYQSQLPGLKQIEVSFPVLISGNLSAAFFKTKND